jgi:hypothetical protein
MKISCSFFSRLALPGLMLLLLTAGSLSADTVAINVNFGGGFTGTGSFNTNGTCVVCFAGVEDQLTNFVFTVDDDTFNEADAIAGGYSTVALAMLYYRGPSRAVILRGTILVSCSRTLSSSKTSTTRLH